MQGKVTPTPKYQILIVYGGQYILFNFCITQNELKLKAKHKMQIHQWHVGVIGFINVHLCISFSVQNNVKSFMPDFFKILQLHFWWYI